MIDAIITFSIRHRYVVIAASAVLAILGLWAAWLTPVDAIPDLSENQVIVFNDWKGHGPREIEDQVTYPLALGLQGVGGVRVVRSSSDVGFSMISVIFEDSVSFDEARRRVGERLARVQSQLPAGALASLAPDCLATGQIFWYSVEGPNLDLGRLRALQDWYVRPQLSSVPGVAEVSSVGGFPYEYEIAVDPRRLQALGVTLREIIEAVAASNSAAGGHVITKARAEYVVRGVGWLGASAKAGDPGFDPRKAVADLEQVPLPTAASGIVRISEVAHVSIAPGYRRGVLEKDGSEVAGGVILMSHGENPLEVTRRLKAKIRQIQTGLPPGVKIVPFYDRTPLIQGVIGTVTGTVVEAMISASLCVLVILIHLRTSFIVAITLPLAALSSFLLMTLLRWAGIVDIQANAMSLAGIAISIGVLVDSSIVMAENVMHRLRERFGNRPVAGDVSDIVLSACLAVGRPIVFSVAIMLLSFLPVFALSGIEGKMFRPLAFTKSFALLAVSVLAITTVPALCSLLIRGKLRSEQENPLVRGVIEVYRPVLAYFMEKPIALAWIVSVTFLVGFAPLGVHRLFLAILFISLAATALLARRRWSRVLAPLSLLLVALVADQSMTPLPRRFLTPLDEGMVMDMPITVPRASMTESLDDLKARDMVLCRFPEVDMVVGKAGRAETPTDPAPLDMIETMVNFRPRELWPRRKLHAADARRQTGAVLEALVNDKVIDWPGDATKRDQLVDEVTEAALPLFDAAMREYAYQRNQEVVRGAGPSPTSMHPDDPAEARLVPVWRDHVAELDGELLDRAATVFTRIAIEQLIERAPAVAQETATYLESLKKVRERGLSLLTRKHESSSGGHHHHMGGGPQLFVEPSPILEELHRRLADQFSRWLILWKIGRDELAGFGGELDLAVQMPGWTNVWTMPIQNRVDMLATGVNTTIGIRVLGQNLDEVVQTSNEIAAVVKQIRGAVDVVADPIRGKPYLEIRFDRERAGRLGVSVGEANDVIEAALAGKTVTLAMEGRERHPVVVRYARDFRQDEESVRELLVPAKASTSGSPAPRVRQVSLSEIADVQVVEGPATIKGENGLLRNYVRLNVRGRDAVDFVDEARQVVAREVKLPESVSVEWTGQFEHQLRARRTLAVVVPIVVVLIFLILYWTYHDLADAALMLLTVPGAIAGGLFFQWLLGEALSVTVWVGYIACFGMATSTGIIMLVYLREALDRAGGLQHITLPELRQAVLSGAVHRLRPKLLTEGTVVIGLAPMLWASGVGSEVIRPMAAPVLGGILVADEVVDLLLPVLFYSIRRWRWRRIHHPTNWGEPVASQTSPNVEIAKAF
ncbi:MAG: efflux RND transporter permease subunit [Isosphaeraceae bacterium]